MHLSDDSEDRLLAATLNMAIWRALYDWLEVQNNQLQVAHITDHLRARLSINCVT